MAGDKGYVLKMSNTSGPIFKKKNMKRYPIFSVQIINYQIVQMHKYNRLLVKFYFKSFKNGYFVFSPYGVMLIFTRLLLKKWYGNLSTAVDFWNRFIWGFTKMYSQFL